ncbi:MAG: hypothetical protein FJX36_01670 [Alphaproteobacteria bacterium]|nr:hypothetical protein [Alphaproteobacteria bacterium]
MWVDQGSLLVVAGDDTGSTSTDEEPGDVHVNDIDNNFTSLNPGGQSFQTLMHEVGHALGLGIPTKARSRCPTTS